MIEDEDGEAIEGTEIRDGQVIVAEFVRYEDAIQCLPALARILRRTLRMGTEMGKVTAPLPRGCHVDSENGFSIICANP